MNPITEAQKKLLTEYLGEKLYANEFIVAHCLSCQCGVRNRTFTTPDDFFALKDKIEEREEWFHFHCFALDTYIDSGKPNPMRPDLLESWIIDKIRFPVLVAEAIEAGIIG